MKEAQLIIDADWSRWQAPALPDEGGVYGQAGERVDAGSDATGAAQREEMRRQGYREGWEHGLREAREAGQAQVAAKFARWQQLVDALDQPLMLVDQEVEQQLARLALTIAHQLLKCELRFRPEQVLAVVREALAAMPAEAGQVRIHLHPEDAALAREVLHDEERAPVIVDDPALTPGGCEVVSERSRIDRRVESRLEQMLNAMLDEEMAPEVGTDSEGGGDGE